MIPVFDMKRWLFWLVGAIFLLHSYLTRNVPRSIILTQLPTVRVISLPLSLFELILLMPTSVLWRNGERIYAYFGAEICSHYAPQIRLTEVLN
jgi:hypothetical protein